MLKKFNLRTLSLIYLCFMTVYMTVREILPLNFLIDSPLVSAAIFAPGFVLIVWDLLTKRNCLSGHVQDLLILFLAVCCLSSVINFRYGIFDNVKFIAALAIEFLIFFCFTKNMEPDDIRKTLNVLSVTLIITWFIPVFFSLLMYFFGIDIAVAHYGAFAMTSQGFSYEFVRLWGIFQDPNYASIMSLVSVLASVRLIVLKKRVLTTVLLVFNALCQLSYIILGGSRAALILLILTILLYAAYRFILNGKKSVKDILKGICAAVLTFAVCLSAVFGIKAALPLVKSALVPDNNAAALHVSSAYNALYSLSDFEFELIQRNSSGEVIFYTAPGGTTAPTPDDIPPDSGLKPLDRTDLGKNDISNGRFARWLQTLQVFAKSPLFGTSPRNLAEFAKEHNPDTLMAKYGIAPHNGYLDVLVETGIVGFVVLAAAVILILFTFLLRFIKKGFSHERAFLTISVLAFAGIAFFISDIYTTFSINSMFFWVFLGMAHNLGREPEQKGIVLSLYNKTIGKLTDKLFTKKGSL